MKCRKCCIVWYLNGKAPDGRTKVLYKCAHCGTGKGQHAEKDAALAKRQVASSQHTHNERCPR